MRRGDGWGGRKLFQNLRSNPSPAPPPSGETNSKTPQLVLNRRGVEVDEESEVLVGLDLTGFGSSGLLPDIFDSLTSLTSLNLSNNLLCGDIPESLSALLHLQ